MKSLLAAILLATTLGSAPIAEPPAHDHAHHEHGLQVVEFDQVARATMFKAVCSKGDLNASYKNRSDAVKAAQKHQTATGHKTSVRKQ
jgi:hypothetical protein